MFCVAKTQERTDCFILAYVHIMSSIETQGIVACISYQLAMGMGIADLILTG